MNISAIAKLLELEEDYVTEIVYLLMQNPEKSDVEIAEEYLRAQNNSRT